ncbi:peptidase C39 family protein [Pseudobacteriovorax antillogorgiicola]
MVIRIAEEKDLAGLLEIEETAFIGDRMSRRSFRHHIRSEHSDLVLVENVSKEEMPKVLAYGLTFRHRGTRLARLYSIAVHPQARGLGLATDLLDHLENLAAAAGWLYMRLEVAKNNPKAIQLYEKSGYRVFGEYSDYYEDHSDALRMQKRIRQQDMDGFSRLTPWYQQTTLFTCGPSSLMMAMSSHDDTIEMCQGTEIDLWREATTVFMTSGHGGCHPFGLALAAKRRGFEALAMVNSEQVLFLDGVRSETKKEVLALVHNQFLSSCHRAGVSIAYQDVTQHQVESWLRSGYSVLILISTYRLDGKKAPHWVVVTGVDQQCFYVHDPYVEPEEQVAIDCQHIPIARNDFDKMSAFGSSRLRAAVALKKSVA